MAAAVRTIEIVRGDDFELPLFFRTPAVGNNPPVYWDLTGWTGRAHLRETEDGPLIASFTVTILDQNTALGGVLVSLDKLITAALVPFVTKKFGKWDLELTDAAGKVTTYMRGDAYLIMDVTHD